METSQYNSVYGLNAEGIGYPVLRMNEFDNLFAGKPRQHSNKFTVEDFNLHVLKRNDVLICRTNGNPKLIGKSALVAKDCDYVYESHLFKVRPRANLINSATLVLYLNTRHGRAEIDRLSMQGNQANFSIAKFKELRIPKFNGEFLEKISELTFLAFDHLQKSQCLYAVAENQLLEALELINFLPNPKAINIKSFKDSFGESGRLDSEYYLPKHEQLVAHITAGSHARLGALAAIQKSIEPGSDAYSEDERGLPFLRVADYSKQGIAAPQVRLSERFVRENAEKLNALKPKKNAILFSKDGSVGEAYQLREDVDFITSGAILHLTVKDKAQVLPDYLTLILNSIVVKQQAERDAGGSIILHWRKEEIENVLVPIVDLSIQQKISTQIQESFKFKAESERLLEVAKRAVEIAIERGEKVASDLIEKGL